MNNKGITNDDFNNLVYLLEGNEILAMEYIEKYSTLALQDMIKMGKALDFANDIGVNAYTTNDLDAARNVLENGGALILNVKSDGDNLFTEGAGHYITVTGINEDGTWHVENPNYQGYTAYLFGEDNFIEEDILSHMKTENFLVLSNEP